MTSHTNLTTESQTGWLMRIRDKSYSHGQELCAKGLKHTLGISSWQSLNSLLVEISAPTFSTKLVASLISTDLVLKVGAGISTRRLLRGCQLKLSIVWVWPLVNNSYPWLYRALNLNSPFQNPCFGSFNETKIWVLVTFSLTKMPKTIIEDISEELKLLFSTI